MLAIMTGVTMTIKTIKKVRCGYSKPSKGIKRLQLKSQFVQVEVALALARVLIGLISAGYNHGSGSQVAPKEAMYV